MAYSQICEFDKYLAEDDAFGPVDDEFMQPINPHTDDAIQIPEKYILKL